MLVKATMMSKKFEPEFLLKNIYTFSRRVTELLFSLALVLIFKLGEDFADFQCFRYRYVH